MAETDSTQQAHIGSRSAKVFFDEVAVKLKVRKIVDALPQRSVIPDEVAERWIEGIVKRDPERAVWHARRASGIGGSEIGELVAHASGQPTTYSTLEQICRQKLLLDFPTRENEHMARGTAMEPLAQKVYWKTSGDKSVLENPEIAQAFSQGHPDHPWLVGNPDEVADNARFGRVITDFKVRSNLDPNEGFKLINVCQLHWYGLIHEGQLGETPDAYALSELDIPTALIDSLMSEENPDLEAMATTIASVNRPGFGISTRYMKHNPALAGHMTRLGEQFWNKYVLSGTPYQTPKPEKPSNLTPQDDQRMRTALNEFIRYKVAENVGKDTANQCRDEAIQIARHYEINDWPFEVPGLSAGYTKSFNVDNAANFLIAKGVARSGLEKPSNTLDMEASRQVLENNGLLDATLFKPSWDARAIKSALKEQGIKANEFEENRFRAGISTKKADQDTRTKLESAMKVHIGEWGQRNQAPASSDLQADQPDVLGSAMNDYDGDDIPDLRLG